MIIYRNKNPKKKGDYFITNKDGSTVKDKSVLDYIKSLVIPCNV